MSRPLSIKLLKETTGLEEKPIKNLLYTLYGLGYVKATFTPTCKHCEKVLGLPHTTFFTFTDIEKYFVCDCGAGDSLEVVMDFYPLGVDLLSIKNTREVLKIVSKGDTYVNK